MRILKIEIMTLLLLATCGLADVRRVPSEYPTIQAAIDGASDGDTVLVAPGTYTGEGNRDIEFKGKAITVKSEDGPETCLIDCQGTPTEPHRGFFFPSDNNTHSVVQGFTILNGAGFSAGGAILCYEASPLITDCLITANTAFEHGGGISCFGSDLTVVRCHISNNNSAQFGGGISVRPDLYKPSVLTLTNCTTTGNNSGSGGGVYCDKSSVDLVNCTVSGNRAIFEGGGICLHQAQSANINNSIIYGNIAPIEREILMFYGVGHGNPPDHPLYYIAHSVVGSDPNAIGGNPGAIKLIGGQWMHLDPLFAQPGYWADVNDPNVVATEPNDPNAVWIEGDYHLKSQAGRWDPSSKSWVKDNVTSPCIDTGDPNSPIDLEPFPNGGIINMGAYGGSSQASKSYFGEPICETIIAGDINGDCKVDFVDFTLIAAHWLEDNTP